MTASPDPPPRPEADLLSAAVEYADQGIAIMPCAERGKKPALPRTGKEHAIAATTDPDQIREWWTRNPNYNIGIVCTANRLAVIDIDGPAGVEWIKDHHLPMPDTWTATTSEGRYHYYYRWPEGARIATRQIAPELEIRAAGAYLVAPPSIHPDGGIYRWADSTRCDWGDLPEVPAAHLDNVVHFERGNGVALKRLAGLADHLATKTPKGERHKALYSTARTLGGLVASGLLTREQIEVALHAATATNGLLAEDGDNVAQTIADGIAKGIADGPDPGHHEPDEGNPYTLRPSDSGHTEPDGTGKRAVGIQFSTVPSEKVDWFYEGRIPLGDLTLLVGPPGLGKTTFACELGARGARGELEGAAADVIFVSAEDSLAHTLVPRFEVAGADLDRAWGMKIVEADGYEVGFTLPDDIAYLQDLVEETGANLVVLDPVVAHLSGSIDSHKDHSVRRALAPLAALAESTGAAVLGIMHLNKSHSTDVLQRINGSGGFGATARSVLLLGEDPKAPEGSPERLLIHAKSNFGHLAPAMRLKVEGRTFTTAEGEEAETAGIVWMGEDQTATAARVLGGRQEPSREDIATDFLRENLAEGPLPRAEVEALAGEEEITLTTLKRAAKKLGIVSKREGFGTGSSWTLPRPTLPIQSIIQPMSQKYELNEGESSRKPLQDNASSIQSIGSLNDELNDDDELNGAPHSVHHETPELNDETDGGAGSRKPLQDNGSSIQSIGSKHSEHLSDEPNSEPNGVEVVLEAFPGADVVQSPNAHLPDLTAPSEPLGVDAEPEPSGQIAPLPWEGGAAGTSAYPDSPAPTSTTHGTRYAYRSRGCRCDECRAWETERKRAQHRRRREGGRTGKT